jgi:uncharacterized protein
VSINKLIGNSNQQEYQQIHSRPIHIFKLNDTNLAYDGNSMYLFEVDNEQADVIRHTISGKPYQKHSTDRQTNSISKLLCEMSDKSANMPLPDFQPNVSRLWLHLAHSCNLRCTYCFAEAGTYCGHRGLMDLSVAFSSVDFLLQQCRSKSAKIVFFGGEPLLNFEVMRETVGYAMNKAEQKGILMHFNLITNLTLMTPDIADFCRDHEIEIQVSLDGPREIHDSQRIFPDGTGSFNRIMENISLMRRHNVPLRGVRATVTDANSDICQLYDFLKKLGFSNVGMVAVQPDPRTGIVLSQRGMDAIKEGYRLIADRIIECIESGEKCHLGPLGTFVKRLSELSGKLSFCDRGVYMISITPDGAIFPCHRVVSEPQMQIGDINKGFYKPLSKIDCMGSFGIDDKPVCQDCWAKRFCGGGCAASALCVNGTVTKPDQTHCQILKEKAEASLRVYYALKRLKEQY